MIFQENEQREDAEKDIYATLASAFVVISILMMVS